MNKIYDHIRHIAHTGNWTICKGFRSNVTISDRQIVKQDHANAPCQVALALGANLIGIDDKAAIMGTP